MAMEKSSLTVGRPIRVTTENVKRVAEWMASVLHGNKVNITMSNWTKNIQIHSDLRLAENEGIRLIPAYDGSDVFNRFALKFGKYTFIFDLEDEVIIEHGEGDFDIKISNVWQPSTTLQVSELSLKVIN